jgi:hypothetical protein
MSRRDESGTTQESAMNLVSLRKDFRDGLKCGLLAAHAQLKTSFLSGAAMTAQTQTELDAETIYHVSETGDVFVSYAETDTTGLEFAVILNGGFGPIPVQMSLRGKLDIASKSIQIILKLLKPFETQDCTWTYDLEGLQQFPSGGMFASGIRLAAPDIATVKGDIDYWCMARCGALSIAPTLVTCLPAFAGGPAAYVACVAANAGDAAAGTAACIAQKCL